MNELLDIIRRLYDEYGSGKHWLIVKAEKIGQDEDFSWNLTIQPEKDGGTANESN